MGEKPTRFMHKAISAAAAAVVVGGALVWMGTGGASASEVLQQAAMQTAAQGGATIAFDAGVNGPAGPTQASGSGTLAFTTGAASFSFSDSAAFPDGAEVRVTGDHAYVRAPQLTQNILAEGKQWISVPIAPVGSLVPESTTTTTTAPAQAADIVRRLTEAGMEVTELGRFDVNGVTTTAYAFVDPDAQGALSGKAYVDDDGLLRRVELDTADTAGKTGALAMDLTTFTVPPEVQPPPAEITVPVAEVLAPLKGDGSGS